MRGFLFATLFLVLFAGCAASPQPKTEAPAFEPRRGDVLGLAVDEEQRPVANVSISLDDAPVATTDDGGRFALRGYLEGRHVLGASHPQYEPVSRDVFIIGDLEVKVELLLVTLPELRPYNFTLPALKGHYDCAAEYLIVTGDCGILYENVTCTLNNCQSDPVWSEKYQFKFDVPPRWQTIVAELVWEESNTNLVDGMRLYLENANVSAQGGHGVRVARVDGHTQPLAMRYEVGVPHAGAEAYAGTSTPAFVPPEGGPQQFRVFPMGQLWQTTRTVCSGTRCLLGVGAALDLDFTVYATIFVNEAAPPGYSYVATLPK